MLTPLQVLKKIGFSEKEQLIYLACLKCGGLTVTGLHRQTQLPRTTIYDMVQKLELKGYLTKSKRTNTLVFYAVSVQELMVLMQDKVQLWEKRKETLREHATAFQEMMQGTEVVPQVKYYVGHEALSLIFSQVKKTDSVRTIFNADIAQQYLGDEYIEDVHSAHKEKKTNKKILLVESSLALNEKVRLQTAGFQVKILASSFVMYGDLMILDDKVLFVSYGDQIQALEIVQPIFVTTQKNMFEYMWECT